MQTDVVQVPARISLEERHVNARITARVAQGPSAGTSPRSAGHTFEWRRELMTLRSQVQILRPATRKAPGTGASPKRIVYCDGWIKPHPEREGADRTVPR
jgi:hypothetical protein